MTSPAAAAFRAEVQAALDTVLPQIRGLQDLQVASIEPDTKTAVDEELAVNVRRRDLLQTNLAALTKLEDDGYPATPKKPVPASVYEELLQQKADLEAALAEFEASVASSVDIALGDAVNTPTT